MSEEKFSFEKMLSESNRLKIREAAVEMFQLFTELCDAGFEKQDAIIILLGMMKNNRGE